MVNVAMSAMMKNDPTRNTLPKVTKSMMTTMTTVLHRHLQKDWSSFSFSTVQVACIQDVLWSLRCCCTSPLIGLDDRVLVSVVTPLFRSSNVILPFSRCSVKLFHTSLRTSLFVHAHIRDCSSLSSAPRSCRNCASARNQSNLFLF